MRRFTRVYGIVAYLFGLASFSLFILFVLGIGLPRSLDFGPAAPVPFALVVDLGLLALFGVQHSVSWRGGPSSAG